MLASIVLAGFSFLQVHVATQDRDRLQARVRALEPVQGEYDRLKKIENEYILTNQLKFFVNRNNNGFRKTIKTLSDMTPKSFRIESIQSNDTEVTISARSQDKLSSLSALQIQLNKIAGFKDVRIDTISESNEQATNRRVYSYTLTFKYVEQPESQEDILAELISILEQGGGQ